MKHIGKRMLCIGAAALMLGGNTPISPGMLPAEAASGKVTYDAENGILTLSGAVTKEQIQKYGYYDFRWEDGYKVKKIVAEEGTILPADCSYLIKGNTYFSGSGYSTKWNSYWAFLEIIDFSKADSSNVYTMDHMFDFLNSDQTKHDKLICVDISGFDTSNVQKMDNMFYDCEYLKTIYVSDKWTTESVVVTDEPMFTYCNSLEGGNGTKADQSRIFYDIDYACIDSPGTNGFFTYKGDKTMVSFKGGTWSKNGSKMQNVFLPADQTTYTLPECGFLPKDDMHFFEKWDLGNPGDVIEVPESKKIVLTAEWWWYGPKTMEFKPNGGNGTMPDVVLNAQTLSYQLPECEYNRAGYFFSGWKWKDKIYQPGEAIILGPNGGTVELIAQWVQGKYVMFHPNGGSGGMNPVLLTPETETYTLPECEYTPPAGYAFDTWDLGDPGTELAVPEEGLAIVAQWKEVPALLFDAGECGSGTMASVYPEEGQETYTLPECGFYPPYAFAFNGWKLEDTIYQPGDEIAVTDGHVTVIAQWVQRTEITFDPGKDGSGEMAPVLLEKGAETYTLPRCTLTPPEGYGFKCWDLGAVGEEIEVTGLSMTLTAQWVKIPSITFIPDLEGLETVTRMAQPDYTTYRLPSCMFKAEGDIFFVGWKFAGKKYMPGDIITLTGDENYVTALWMENAAEISICNRENNYSVVYGCSDEYFIMPKCPHEAPEGKVFAGYDISILPFILYEGDRYVPEFTDLFDNFGYDFIGEVHIFDVVWETPHDFTVTFDPGEGGSGTMKDVLVTDSAVYQLPESTFTPPEDKKFFCWYIEGATKTVANYEGKYVTVPGDTLKLTAIWRDSEPTCYLGFLENGGSGTMDEMKVREGEYLTLPECGFTAPEGKFFGGWKDGSIIYQPGDMILLTEYYTTINAYWCDSFNVSFSSGSGKGATPSVTVDSNKYTLPECDYTAPENRVFAGWLVNGAVMQPGEEATLTGNTTIIALWDYQAYDVTFDAAGGTGEMTGGTVLKGGSFYLPECAFTAPEGKYFAGWQIGEDTYQPMDMITVDAETIVKPVWETVYCTVTFDPNGGTGEIEGQSVLPGTEITLPENTFTAPKGSEFIGWLVGKKNYESGDKVVITENTTILALWTEPVTTILIGDADGSGAVDDKDAMLLARYAAGWDGIEINLAACDFNGDGTVDEADAMILARYVAGWEGYDKYIVSKTV